MTSCSSGGSGPTTSMPGTSISSLTCWTASSTSPLAASSPVRPLGITVALAFTRSAIPSLRISAAKKMPLAPARE